MLECVINISEGRRLDVIGNIGRAAGAELLDVHTDPDHHRSVLTVIGAAAARSVGAATILSLDLASHEGVHPRIGVLDVVPFVPLAGSTMADAVLARDAMAMWLAEEFSLPCFLYGPERSLPDVRRGAFTALVPDTGPTVPHPQAGACAVGARPILVAYNVWLADPDVGRAKEIAREVRGPAVRALGLGVGGEAQVSMNLIDPATVNPAHVYDAIAEMATIDRAELVGLLPEAILRAIEPGRWSQLDLSADRTIEARLTRAGAPAGRADER